MCHADVTSKTRKTFVPFVSFVANPDTYQNFHHAFFTGSTPPVSL